MKSILYKLIIVSAGMSVMTSCDDFFDEEPVNKVSVDAYFNSENALEIYANGLLDKYLPSEADITLGDQYSDISATNVTEGFLKPDTYTVAGASNWTRSNWEQLFNVNYFLKHMEKAKGAVSEDIYNHYEGVGRFWRAWFYWKKVKTFGDVPWYDAPIDPDDEEALYKGRDSRAYVMDKVLDDLDFACAHCSSATKFVDHGVINKWIALALKSRVCLFEGTFRKYHGLSDYQKFLNEAASASKELMDSSPYSLLASAGGEETNYGRLFKSEEIQTQEVMLALQFSTQMSKFHSTSWDFASASKGKRNSATKAFVNMYLNRDGSRFTDNPDYRKVQFKDEFTDRDYRVRQTLITPFYKKTVNGAITSDFTKTFPDLGSQLTYYRVIKWNTDNAADENRNTSNNSLPIFRFGETLLIYAEAMAELGQMSNDVWDSTIRLLRERSGVSGMPPSNPDPYLSDYYDGLSDKWILEVRRERTIEMFYECVRRDDLRRWKMGHKFEVEFNGIYIPVLDEPFDLNGDGIDDICFYFDKKPSVPKGVTCVQLSNNPNDKKLRQGRSEDGSLIYRLEREWKDCKYLYPVPKVAIDINPNLLPQNPGWED